MTLILEALEANQFTRQQLRSMLRYAYTMRDREARIMLVGKLQQIEPID